MKLAYAETAPTPAGLAAPLPPVQLISNKDKAYSWLYQLLQEPDKCWQGLFHSVYSMHLINVTETKLGHAVTLAEVREDVRLDWLGSKTQQRCLRWVPTYGIGTIAAFWCIQGVATSWNVGEL